MRVLIIGPTACGKTHFANTLISGHEKDTLLIDDFYAGKGKLEALIGNATNWIVVIQHVRDIRKKEREELFDIIFEHQSGTSFGFQIRFIQENPEWDQERIRFEKKMAENPITRQEREEFEQLLAAGDKELKELWDECAEEVKSAD